MNSTTPGPIYLVYYRKSLETKGYEGPPYGLLYVGQALKDAGYRVRVLHCRDNHVLEDAIRQERPLWVGFSCFVSPFLKQSIAGSRLVHSLGIPVVWGGVFPTVRPELVLADGCVDYVVVGEGEIAAVRLSEAIENGEPPKGIPGVAFRDGDQFVLTPPEPPELELDRFRYGLELLDWDHYILRHPGSSYTWVGIPFSRGCPFRCGFCYNTMNPNRQKWRSHSVEFMKELIDFYRRRHGVTNISFVGDNAFGNQSKAREIIEQLDIDWTGFIHLTGITEDFLDWARAHRCNSIHCGIESGSDRMLKLMKKGVTVSTVRDKLHLAKDKGMPTVTNFMMMMPGETMDDLRRTLEFMDEISEQDLAFQIPMNPYRAYPETPFYEASLELGLREPRTLDEWGAYQPLFNSHLGFTPRQVNRIHLLIKLLYTKGAAKSPVPRWMRPALKKRLFSFDPSWPIEETLYAAWTAYQKLRRAQAPFEIE